MLQRKPRLVNSMLVGIFLLSCATISSAANKESSSFSINLFNNTNSKPLYYSITSKGEMLSAGILPAEDHGKFVKIDGESKEKASAEIVVTESSGHKVWGSKVSFWGSNSEFYTTTVSLDPAYKVGVHPLPSIQTIGFEITN